ncbi:hypothetical protein ALP75_201572 [Pseudomonas syringae pv. actinidiae]|nr:hypothetical protein ALP75_201572 [Pseudomonas syringae pv. actinidiae]
MPQHARARLITRINDYQPFFSKVGQRTAFQGIEQKSHTGKPGAPYDAPAGRFHTCFKHDGAPSSFNVGAFQKFWMIEYLASKANQRHARFRVK